jgi:uncharacterized protein (DUF1015 family)
MTQINPLKASFTLIDSNISADAFFYCCRVKNDIFESKGLICSISKEFLGKTILGHERSIDSKVLQYYNHFRKYSKQLAPITLTYNENCDINNLLILRTGRKAGQNCNYR